MNRKRPVSTVGDRAFPYSADKSRMDVALGMAILALIFFTAALGFWVAAWFLRRKDGRFAFTMSVIFGVAGFLDLIVWRLASNG